MKLATFNGPQGQRVGVVDVDRQLLINLDEPDMISLLESGADGLRRAAKKVASASSAPNTTSVLALDEIELCAPVVRPRKVLALAGNYAEHIQEGGKLARQDSQTPRVFMKPPSSTVIGPGRNILLPAIAREIDWEGELAVVIGSHCKAISADEALDHVAGYTIMNDVSERALKIWKRSKNRPIDDFFDWLNGKWYDTFAPMGAVAGHEGRDPRSPDAADQHFRQRPAQTAQQHRTDDLSRSQAHRVHLGHDQPRARRCHLHRHRRRRGQDHRKLFEGGRSGEGHDQFDRRSRKRRGSGLRIAPCPTSMRSR